MIVYDTNNMTIAPEFFTDFTYADLSTAVNITNIVGNNYNLLIDEAFIETLVTIDNLFKFVLSTPMAPSNKIEFEQFLVLAIKESLPGKNLAIVEKSLVISTQVLSMFHYFQSQNYRQCLWKSVSSQ